MSTRTLSRAALIEGARQALPLALSIFAYGLVFGVLAGQAGLSAPESLLMSMLVFAGSAQFVALGLWVAPLPVVPIVLTTLVVNVRHVLMGAALRPVLDDLPRRLAYASVFFMTDESWALTMSESAAGRGGSGFFIGSSLTMYVAWFSSTLVGRTLGGALHDPTRLGLDFAFVAVFIALLVRLWNGTAAILPWLVAGLAAVVAAHLLPGKWYILIGGLVGSVVGAIRYEP